MQQQFQPALDAYLAKAIPDEDAAERALAEACEWDSRWPVPIERYRPVLRLARARGYALLALGIDSEALSKVQQVRVSLRGRRDWLSWIVYQSPTQTVVKVGLEGLSEVERGAYVADPSGFIQSVKLPAFKLYAERFILPAFAQRARQEAAASR